MIAPLSPVIHDISRTAVKGLAAEPIIDMLIAVNGLDQLEIFSGLIGEIGYVAKGENGINPCKGNHQL